MSPTGVEKPFFDYRRYMVERYGKPLFKVPVDFNYGCPHRDQHHQGGCTFCPEDGSRAVQIMGIDSLEAQIKTAMDFSKRRYGAQGFACYVQAYTATFAPARKFREQITDLLDRYPFDALHLGTRPDCLPEGTLDVLQELSEKIDLWVELGLQTVHDRTLEFIQREHDWACSEKGIQKLSDRGIQVVSHVILGLPGESREDMVETARVMARQPLDGIKIHNLHVIEGTEMAHQHRRKPFRLLGEQEYLHLLTDFLQELPPKMPVMRINTDTPNKDLVAPHWHIEKGQLRRSLETLMHQLDVRQGDRYHRPQRPISPATCLITRDGSTTMAQPDHGEMFHPRSGARTYARETFLKPALENLKVEGEWKAIDLGFGLGYLSHTILSEGKGSTSIEAFEVDRRALKAFLASNHDSSPDHHALLQDALEGEHHHPKGQLHLHWGDARHHLQKLPPAQTHLIFHDPFDEKNNTELVSLELMQWLAHLLHPEGVIISSRQHPSFRRALELAGLHWSPLEVTRGTLARHQPFETHHTVDLTDPRAIPYRDPHLCSSHREIVRTRQQEQESASPI